MANRIPIYKSGSELCQSYGQTCSTNTCKCDGKVVMIDCSYCDKESDADCAQSDKDNCNIHTGTSGCSCNTACYGDGGTERPHTCTTCDWQCTSDGVCTCNTRCNGCDSCDSCDGCNTRSQTCDCYNRCYGQATSCSSCNQTCYGQPTACGCYSPSCYQEAVVCTCYQLRYNYTPCQTCDGCDSYIPCETCDVSCYMDTCAQCHHATYSQPW